MLSTAYQSLLHLPRKERIEVERKLLSQLTLGPSLPQQSEQGVFPLTEAQREIWLHWQLTGRQLMYNEPEAVRISGPLDVSRLEKSIVMTIENQAMLRMTLTVQDGVPFLSFRKDLPRFFNFVDLSKSNTDLLEECNKLIADDQQAFDLERELPIRATLACLSENEHVLLLVLHHLCCDRDSIGVIARAISHFYQKLERGSLVEPAPQTQYHSTALFSEAKYLKSSDFEEDLHYWKQKLNGRPPALIFPRALSNGSAQEAGVGTVRIELEPGLYLNLKRAARSSSVSIFAVLSAALNSLLMRFCQQDDLQIGISISHRDRIELQSCVGKFSQAAILRTSLSDDPPFSALLERVNQGLRELHAHSRFPLSQAVQLQKGDDLSYAEPFQVLLSLKNKRSMLGSLELADCASAQLQVSKMEQKYDLVFSFYVDEGCIEGSLEYNKSSIAASVAQQLVDSYVSLLEQAITYPSTNVSTLPLLNAKERARILADWNPAPTPYPSHHSISECFDEQVEVQPAAIAVISEGEELSYRELQRQANQLAHFLTRQSVKPGDLVGLCIPKSCRLIVAMLGILKCGAAYLPLDASNPTARISQMIADSGASVVLTTERQAKFFDGMGAKVICLDAQIAPIESDTAPVDYAKAESIAYVMYTSGSTGAPKGVEVVHRAVVRLVKNTNYVAIGPGDRILQLSTVSFDASTFEIFAPLLNGGTVVLPQDGLPDFEVLEKTLQEQKITHMFLTTALYNTLIDIRPQSLAGLRRLLTGGEAMSTEHVRLGLKLLPNTNIANIYGPTENTTFSLFYDVPRDIDHDTRSIPLGKPIANTTAYVLDSSMNPLPPFVKGEIYLGGDGLARGYRHSPALTRSKFLDTKYGVLYKTGDLGSYLPDGNIMFDGRIDHQVKIRGFRIEPSEIELLLDRHECIKKAVVLAKQTARGKELAGYILPATGSQVYAREIKEWLREHLPDYMIPSTIAFVTEFPIGVTGKIDRTKLLDVAPETEEEYSSSLCQTMTEEIILGIFEDYLKTNLSRADVDFFDLGGHSLLAVQIAAKISSTYSLDIPASILVDNPTPRKLARVVDQMHYERHLSSPHEIPLVTLRSSGSGPPLYLIPGGNGAEHVFLKYARLARLLNTDQPVIGLQPKSMDRKSKFTVEEMAAHFLGHMRKHQARGPYYVAGACVAGVVAVELANQIESQGEEVGALILLDALVPGPERFWRHRLRWWCARSRQILDETFGKLWENADPPPGSPGAQVLKARLRRHLRKFLDDRLPMPYEKAPSDLDFETAEYHKVLLKRAPRPWKGQATIIVSESNAAVGAAEKWERLIFGGLKVLKSKGTHDSWLSDGADCAARLLSECLNEALNRSSVDKPSAQITPRAY